MIYAFTNSTSFQLDTIIVLLDIADQAGPKRSFFYTCIVVGLTELKYIYTKHIFLTGIYCSFVTFDLSWYEKKLNRFIIKNYVSFFLFRVFCMEHS